MNQQECNLLMNRLNEMMVNYEELTKLNRKQLRVLKAILETSNPQSEVLREKDD